MKKFIIMLILIGISGFFIKNYIDNQTKEEKIKEIKENWYVEIITDYINIRKEADQYTAKLGTVSKGEVYKVIKYSYVNNIYWFKIKYTKYITGWISNGKKNDYLKNYNSKTDFITPIIYLDENIYYVNSIDDINHDHLRIWDDDDNHEITSVVYHEYDDIVNPTTDQYWIVYTVIDKNDKSSRRTQKIVFEKKPKENQIEDWKNFK
jgi:hypothetical protein